MSQDKPNERQRLLETRITRTENQIADLAGRVSELTDQVTMLTHHLQRLREGAPVVSSRHH